MSRKFVDNDFKYRESSTSCTVSRTSSKCFNYHRHKSTLNRMFFTGHEKITPGTKEHQDFWAFLTKYQETESRLSDEKKSQQDKILTEMRKSMIDNWRDENLVDLLSLRGSKFGTDYDEPANLLTQSKLIKFRDIILIYNHFLEQKRQRELMKLAKDRAALPITEYRTEILEKLRTNQVILIAGDTGCGKSTQIPQYLLDAGYDQIAVTQPRRIACISLAKRVAYERQCHLGTDIGYQIRFTRVKSTQTKTLFITEGLLLRQISTDPFLSSYNIIIMDEVHERHLSCDFLLGVMRCLLFKRPDLKLILMSATINSQLFSNYFGQCPSVEVPGRLFPIELLYVPAEPREIQSIKVDPTKPFVKMLEMIDAKYDKAERGDVLIFLSGLAIIRQTARTLREYASKTGNWVILILHSSLSISEQDLVFDQAPNGVRKCILSTNIAETSVTIDGIRFVIDSGKVKEMNYSVLNRMQILQEFTISKASAEQRKGRAGRTGPGVCFRLYSKKEFDEFPLYSTAEISRVSLDNLLLQMIAMGLPDARKFPFIEAPSLQAIEESLVSLRSCGALDETEKLTPIGEMLACLPVDIVIGKMLILGSVFDLIDGVLTLGALLSVQSPICSRDFSVEAELMEKFDCSNGDVFMGLKLYQEWLEIKESNGDSRKWCRRNGLEEQRFYEITNLRQQFCDVLKDCGLYHDEEIELRPTSSSERQQRHGELRMLRKLKRELENTPAERKRKLLKVNFDGELVDRDEMGTTDIKDIDFKLSHSAKRVEALRKSSTVYDKDDLLLMKVILCSGLHPQLAIADEFNAQKKASEQIFHTMNQSYVNLNPTSVYSLDPDLFYRDQNEKSSIFARSSTTTMSINHSLITYVSLIRTTKPFLTNCTKIPAAHILVLMANHIDSNEQITRLVCDNWLELKLDSPSFLRKAFEIRELWQKLLTDTFKECFQNSSGDDEGCRSWRRSEEICDVQRKLTDKIRRFMRQRVPFTVRCLLSAEQKFLYRKSPRKFSDEDYVEITKDEIDSSIISEIFEKLDKEKIHPDSERGGLVIREYFTFNSLAEEKKPDKKDFLRQLWSCEFCEKTFPVTDNERLRHKDECKKYKEKNEGEKIDENDDENIGEDPLKKEYFCSDCGKKYRFSIAEIIKHTRTHQIVSEGSDEINTQLLKSEKD